MSVGYWETLATQLVDGPTITAAAQASCIDNTARYTMAANRLRIGDVLRLTAFGRLSSPVTTPGSFNWALTWGVNNATKIFDTLPLAGNTTVQSNVPVFIQAEGIVRAVGPAPGLAAAKMFWGGMVASTAFVNVAAPATGPWAGVVSVPYNVAPVVSTGFDSTVVTTIDFCYQPTVTGASFTLHTYTLSLLTSSGF
jgi:hypothetical protein